MAFLRSLENESGMLYIGLAPILIEKRACEVCEIRGIPWDMASQAYDDS